MDEKKQKERLERKVADVLNKHLEKLAEYYIMKERNRPPLFCDGKICPMFKTKTKKP